MQFHDRVPLHFLTQSSNTKYIRNKSNNIKITIPKLKFNIVYEHQHNYRLGNAELSYQNVQKLRYKLMLYIDTMFLSRISLVNSSRHNKVKVIIFNFLTRYLRWLLIIFAALIIIICLFCLELLFPDQ